MVALNPGQMAGRLQGFGPRRGDLVSCRHVEAALYPSAPLAYALVEYPEQAQCTNQPAGFCRGTPLDEPRQRRAKVLILQIELAQAVIPGSAGQLRLLGLGES